MAKKNSKLIHGIKVESNYPYIVYGKVRGLVSEHRSERAAEKSLAKDRRGCSKQGGYSDAQVYVCM
jgi:hypothetical protein